MNNVPKLNLSSGGGGNFEGDVPEAVIKRRYDNLAKVAQQNQESKDQNPVPDIQFSGAQTERKGRPGRKFTELNIPNHQVPFSARDPSSLHTDYEVHPNLAPGRPRLSSITTDTAPKNPIVPSVPPSANQKKKLLQPMELGPQVKLNSTQLMQEPISKSGMPTSWLDQPAPSKPPNNVLGNLWEDKSAQPKDSYRRQKGPGLNKPPPVAPLPIPAGHYYVAKQSKYTQDKSEMNDYAKASPRYEAAEDKGVMNKDASQQFKGRESKLYDRSSRMSKAEPLAETPEENNANGISPAMAIQHKSSQLTDAEMSEILDFPSIYYIGDKDVKVKTDVNKPNKGYDDERGDYKMTAGDHLSFRFEVLENLGKGSFGAVFKCKDHKLGSITAVKIIRNKKRFQQQARIEVKILNKLHCEGGARANCIQIYDTFDFRGHTCLIFPLYGLNLYEYLKVKGFRGCSLPFVRQVAIQLLDCLSYLAKHNIIHCDLKPENILLKNEQKAQIVIIDFGSSCYVKETIYTYIQSRFYRSPEVILGLEYSLGIDVWSFACIIPELYTAYPLFPGENENDQMACISELIGQPPMHLVNRSTRRKQLFHDSGELRIQPSPRGKIRTPNSRSFDDIRGNRAGDQMFTSFLQRCIRWDPEDRPSADQLMSHPWIDGGSTLPAAAPNERGKSSRIFNR
mmetsp:Transcript_36374/g.37050  ORF Transcript_36374/g.37050 Transcript_36374/m.37050 type:complete len:679 (-) Transcript_36374:132-2168(-)|eukprot:CAMPEP_0182423768 /NCGR_PEP_ID=MMETSP1167-20130531/9854_1 /TAXON_ID=2988 /ORGANISM="Mallomonas Sp, Strain CCMP3275" /LENGTH=678 /DNA_ID=CAMNT_0024603041 /DNA_START=128 /DNA_END=2164 /DNA_ORIENTATION=-